MRLKSIEQADCDFEYLLKYDPKQAEAHLERVSVWLFAAEIARALGNSPKEALARANSSAENTLRLDPKNSRVFVLRGAIRYWDGEWASAIESYEQAIARDPWCAEAHIGCGVVRCELSQVGESVRDFSMAIEINPGSPEAFVHRGLVHRKSDNRGAIQDLTKSLELARAKTGRFARKSGGGSTNSGNDSPARPGDSTKPPDERRFLQRRASDVRTASSRSSQRV